jgi:hypothetical protein
LTQPTDPIQSLPPLAPEPAAPLSGDAPPSPPGFVHRAADWVRRHQGLTLAYVLVAASLGFLGWLYPAPRHMILGMQGVSAEAYYAVSVPAALAVLVAFVAGARRLLLLVSLALVVGVGLWWFFQTGGRLDTDSEPWLVYGLAAAGLAATLLGTVRQNWRAALIGYLPVLVILTAAAWYLSVPRGTGTGQPTAVLPLPPPPVGAVGGAPPPPPPPPPDPVPPPSETGGTGAVLSPPVRSFRPLLAGAAHGLLLGILAGGIAWGFNRERAASVLGAVLGAGAGILLADQYYHQLFRLVEGANISGGLRNPQVLSLSAELGLACLGAVVTSLLGQRAKAPGTTGSQRH